MGLLTHLGHTPTVVNMTTTSLGAGHGRHYVFGQTDRLRAAREQAGLSQSDLAHITGISLKSVTRYEAGDTRPRRPQLIAWAMATGFGLEWLETGKAPSPDDDGAEVRREGFEPPTRWLGLSPSHSPIRSLRDAFRLTASAQAA